MKSFLMVLSFVLMSSPVFAADQDQNKKDCEDQCWGHHSKNGFMKLSPRFFSNSNSNRNSAYTANGFVIPSSASFGFGAIFGRSYESGLEVGLNFLQGGQNRESGTSEARYNYFYGGVYTGYNFLKDSKTDLILGSSINYGSTNLQVFSGVSNGELSERSFMIEPSISVARQFCKNFKLGLVTSYLIPFGYSASIVGQDLAVRSIAPRGISVGLQLIFGRFGEEEKTDKK